MTTAEAAPPVRYEAWQRGTDTLVRVSPDEYVLISHDETGSREWPFTEGILSGAWAASWEQDGPILLTRFTRR